MKRNIKFYLALLVLLISSTGAWAQNRIGVSNSIANGTVAVDNANPTGAATVTLTVTPATGYYITAGDITVTRTAAGAQAPNKAPGIDGTTYPVTAVSVDGTGKGTYSFQVEAGYNAYVEATFTACSAIMPSVSIDGWTYGDAGNNPSVTGNPGNGAVTIAYKVKDTADDTYSATKPSDAGNYTVRATITAVGHYLGGSATKNFSIERKEAELSWSNLSFTYDGNAHVPTATVSNLVGSDDCTVTVTGSQTEIGDYTATATVLSNGNYKLPAANTHAFNIVAASMGDITASAYNATYDGAAHGITVKAPTGATVKYRITASGDYNLAENPTFTNVGNYTVYYQVTKSGYTPFNGSQTVVITAKTLTITAKAKTITYGDTPANDGVTYSGFVGAEDESMLSGTLAYSYDYAQYGNVGSYSITPSGITSTNYAITYMPGTLTVGQKEIGLDWANTILTYTGSEQVPTCTATGTVNNDMIGITVSGGKTEVGNYTATASALTGEKAGNYKLPAANTHDFSITEASMGDITASAYNATYDGAAHGITVNTPFGATVKYRITASGDYNMTENPTFTNVGNYTVYYQVSKSGYTPVVGSQTVTITAKALTASITAENKVYDGNNTATVIATVETGVTGETLSISGLTGTFDNAAVGTGKTVTVNSSAAVVTAGANTKVANYTITYPATTTANITVKEIVSPDDPTDPNYNAIKVNVPTEGYTYDGTEKKPAVTVKDGEKTLTLDKDYTVSYQNNKDAGNNTATVTVKGTSNYSINTTRQFSIAQKALTASVTAEDKTYDGNTNATVSATVETGVTGETLSISGLTGTFDNAEVGTGKTVAVNSSAAVVTAGANTKTSNYTITYPATTTANITLKQIISPDDPTDPNYNAIKVNVPTEGYTYDGTEKKPAVTVKDGTTTLTIDKDYTVSYQNNKDAGTATVTILGAGDYSINTTRQFSIAQKALTVTVKAQNKVYDGNTTATVSGSVETGVTGETLTISGLTGTFDNAEVGTGKTVTVNSSAAEVTAGANTKTSNYTITYPATTTANITPLTGVVVTITGHTNKTAYDGTEHSISGYDVKISNALYKESDFTFNGTAKAARTEVGKTMMGLAADQFTNNNANFGSVTFNVTDGYQEITSIDEVIVTIIGHINTADYDGTEHKVSGYDVKISNALYKETDFTFSGTAEAKRTDTGKTMMGLDVSQFTNNNANYGTVTFIVTDGYQEISPIVATVTITGHNDVVTYDGTEHKVSGYDATFSNNLYKVTDFTFSGTAEATRTEVGKTMMGLAADQFKNNNANFTDVIFNVTDGYMCITSVTDVVVTITGNNNTADYDGIEHQVNGFSVKISNPLYKESDFTFNGTAKATRMDAGTTIMGLDASQFTNKNIDFTNVIFNVTDGYQEIRPITATVTITGHRDIVVYDGTEHKVSGYDATFSNNLYKETDFTFNGTAEAKRIDQGTTSMGLAVDQFANTNTNFSTVTFSVTDGYQTINKKAAALTITVKPKTYDGNTDAEVNVTVNTRVKGESMSITGLAGTFDNVNAGTGKTVTVNSKKAVVTVGENTKLENYEVVYPTQAIGTITKRPVVVSGITAQDKDYDGNTDATLVFDNVKFDGILDGDKLTVTATGQFENAEAGENKTVFINELTLGGESVANYELAADGQQTSTTATIHQTIFDRSHSGILVRRNDTNELVDNNAFLTVMADGTLRIDQVSIINPDPVNGIIGGVSMYIPAILKDYDGTTGAIYGVGSDIIVTDANVPVTDIYMPETDAIINVAQHAFRLDATESSTARIHTPLVLLDDYALAAGLKAEYESAHVMTTIKTTTQYWTLSSGVDIVIPEGVKAHTCQEATNGKVTIKPINSISVVTEVGTKTLLKANNGALMKGTPGSYDLVAWPSAEHASGSTPSENNAMSYPDNQLIPVIVSKHFDYGKGYYVLKNGEFHAINNDDSKVPACKAVFQLADGAKAPQRMAISNGTSGIGEVSCDTVATDGTWYSLDGHKLEGKPTAKGIYIINGKKTIIK